MNIASESVLPLSVWESSLQKSQGLCIDKDLRRNFIQGHPRGLMPRTHTETGPKIPRLDGGMYAAKAAVWASGAFPVFACREAMAA